TRLADGAEAYLAVGVGQRGEVLAAEDQVGGAAVVAAILVAGCRHHEVGDTVAVHVAGGRDRKAGPIVIFFTDQLEPGGAARLPDRAEVDLPVRSGQVGKVLAAEYHVRRTRVDAANGMVVGADDDVGDAVAIHVAGRRDRETGFVIRGPHEFEPAKALTDAAETDGAVGGERGEVLAAEHDVDAAAVFAARLDSIGADDEIGKAVAVHVARRRHRNADVVVVLLADEAEAERAARLAHAAEVD